MGPTSSKKLRLENLERRRRTARDWWLYNNALQPLKLYKGEEGYIDSDPLNPYTLALIANGLRWSLLAIADDPATSSDPMLIASLPEIENKGERQGIDEARHLLTLAIASLRNYRRGQS